MMRFLFSPGPEGERLEVVADSLNEAVQTVVLSVAKKGLPYDHPARQWPDKGVMVRADSEDGRSEFGTLYFQRGRYDPLIDEFVGGGYAIRRIRI